MFASVIRTKIAKKVALTLMYAGWIPVAMAQYAPEIVVTDSDGIAHDLYGDYLDQGQSVMIGLFFSSCTPCQTIADNLEILYQEWGSGLHDVQFIQISNQTWETDETVNTFKATFGAFHPIVSAQGGSLEAVMALVDGEFGDYVGAPLYLVIAPDGTVQWDIFGFGEEAAIDAALLTTGAMKPVVSYVATTISSYELSLFPNPVSTLLCVVMHDGVRMPFSVEIFNHLGRRVHRTKISDITDWHLDVNNWKPGLYLLTLQTGPSIVKQLRFIKI